MGFKITGIVAVISINSTNLSLDYPSRGSCVRCEEERGGKEREREIRGG